MQDFSLARRAMVDNQLRPEGVTDRGVLAAMGSVERERFVPEAARALAYFDRPLQIGDGPRDDAAGRARPAADANWRRSPASARSSSGRGTGYSAALLGAIGLDVVALESDKALAAAAPTPASRPWSATWPGLGQGRALRPHPDRRRGRGSSGRAGQAAARRRPARPALSSTAASPAWSSGAPPAARSGLRSIADAEVDAASRIRTATGLHFLIIRRAACDP